VSIIFLPTEFLSRVAKMRDFQRLMTRDMAVNRSVMRMISQASGVPQSVLNKAAAKVIRDYKRNVREEVREGSSKGDAVSDVVNDSRLLVQRVSNLIIAETSAQLKSEYRGKRYRWLPSDANEPRPEHQAKYGKVFVLGRGEAPQDAYGCRCGMEILVDTGDEDEEI
jgi:hypothetical protein